MNFYLDFEANAKTEEIIAIGCVAEDGRSFYTLVRPSNKLDKIVSLITGITQEDLDEASNIIDALLGLYRFFTSYEGTPALLVWGSDDQKYLRASAKYINNKILKDSLIDLADKLTNVMPKCAKKFHRKHINLESAYLTMNPNPKPLKAHNSLDDAMMLKYVYENINSYELPEGTMPIKVCKPRFNGYEGTKYDTPIRVTMDSEKKGHREWEFNTVYAALSVMNIRKDANKEKVMDKMMEAAREGKVYAGKRFYLT